MTVLSLVKITETVPIAKDLTAVFLQFQLPLCQQKPLLFQFVLLRKAQNQQKLASHLHLIPVNHLLQKLANPQLAQALLLNVQLATLLNTPTIIVSKLPLQFQFQLLQLLLCLLLLSKLERQHLLQLFLKPQPILSQAPTTTSKLLNYQSQITQLQTLSHLIHP